MSTSSLLSFIFGLNILFASFLASPPAYSFSGGSRCAETFQSFDRFLHLAAVKVHDDGDLEVAEPPTKAKKKTKRPPKYKVLFLNDEYTPMEFVVYLLQEIFHYDQAMAHYLMLEVHKKGVAVVGVYTHDVAETKRDQVLRLAVENQHPFKAAIEKDGEGDEE